MKYPIKQLEFEFTLNVTVAFCSGVDREPSNHLRVLRYGIQCKICAALFKMLILIINNMRLFSFYHEFTVMVACYSYTCYFLVLYDVTCIGLEGE